MKLNKLGKCCGRSIWGFVWIALIFMGGFGLHIFDTKIRPVYAADGVKCEKSSTYYLQEAEKAYEEGMRPGRDILNKTMFFTKSSAATALYHTCLKLEQSFKQDKSYQGERETAPTKETVRTDFRR